MKKLSLALMLIAGCTQQIHSQELAAITTTTKQFNDEFSKQLFYTKDITEIEIDDLVKKGADVNYMAMPLNYAYDKTEQGIKNMQTIIKHGAALHNKTRNIPLTIAISRNNIPMIKLLLPYETPETNGKIEEEIRHYIIKNSFSEQNFEIIQQLCDLKLMTANQGVTTYVKLNKTDKPYILEYLVQQGATNLNEELAEIKSKICLSAEPLLIVHNLCHCGAFDSTTLTEMRKIGSLINSITNYLEKNQETINHNKLDK